MRVRSHASPEKACYLVYIGLLVVFFTRWLSITKEPEYVRSMALLQTFIYETKKYWVSVRQVQSHYHGEKKPDGVDV